MARLHHNFLTLDLPDNWEDASQVIALGPDDGGFRPNLVFSQERTKPRETSAQFARRQLPELQAALDNYFLVSEREAQFGPNIGYLREHSYSAQQAENMQQVEIGQIQFYCVIDDVAYTFTFTHLLDKMESARQLGEFLMTRAMLKLDQP